MEAKFRPKPHTLGVLTAVLYRNVLVRFAEWGCVKNGRVDPRPHASFGLVLVSDNFSADIQRKTGDLRQDLRNRGHPN